jgi:tetratricopeptide (TPR) repeat protein
VNAPLLKGSDLYFFGANSGLTTVESLLNLGFSRMSNVYFENLRRFGLCVAVLAIGMSEPTRAQTNAPEAAAATASSSENTSSNDTLRAYLQLQEQLHEARLAIERTREQSEQASTRNAEALATQLQKVEQTLAVQRSHETRFVVIVLSVFGAISFLAVVLTAFFQWRTVNRLANFTTSLPQLRSQGVTPNLPALGFGEGQMIPATSVEEPNLRLLGAIERLEKRIAELETAAGAPTPVRAPEAIADAQNGRLSHGSATPATPAAPSNAPASDHGQIKLLLEKGQSLLNEDKPEAAVGYFDEVLTLEPKNTEALVKKGAALEKMRKLQEAIECYDRAIAADNTMTIAYLHKGGLFNRMERFGEAVECYEQALRTQEKRGG